MTVAPAGRRQDGGRARVADRDRGVGVRARRIARIVRLPVDVRRRDRWCSSRRPPTVPTTGLGHLRPAVLPQRVADDGDVTHLAGLVAQRHRALGAAARADHGQRREPPERSCRRPRHRSTGSGSTGVQAGGGSGNRGGAGSTTYWSAATTARHRRARAVGEAGRDAEAGVPARRHRQVARQHQLQRRPRARGEGSARDRAREVELRAGAEARHEAPRAARARRQLAARRQIAVARVSRPHVDAETPRPGQPIAPPRRQQLRPDADAAVAAERLRVAGG